MKEEEQPKDPENKDTAHLDRVPDKFLPQEQYSLKK